jgi:uncharacterized protein YjaG (DUF416 family)
LFELSHTDRIDGRDHYKPANGNLAVVNSMVIYRYDEDLNVRLLYDLSLRSRIAFALLCATRLLPVYRRYHGRGKRGKPGAVEGFAEQLWRDLSACEMSNHDIELAVAQCEELIPTEENGRDEDTQYANDAVSALAYAVRTRLTGEPQEAAWAGRRAFESVYSYVGALLENRSGIYDDHAIMSHQAIQAELARQRRDLLELAALEQSGTLDTRLESLRHRAEREAAAMFPLK